MKVDREPSRPPLVMRLAQAHEVSWVGGKAVRLARLLQAGLPVPDGVVVTTRAFRLFIESGAPSMPAQVAQAIRRAYQQMGRPTVAVRSSATAEDMEQASMAGQYETFLDVQGEQALLEAVLRCWQSVDSARTGAYLARHQIAVEQVAMAVVIQRLVPAEKAGVLFTANPRTGQRHQMVIEAAWGLGETVVSGQVQPDLLVLDRATGAVISARIADKQVWLEPGSRQVRPVPQQRRKVNCLNSHQVYRLWKLGLKVMDRFDRPQDIEWAIAGDQVYLLQTRPVTTLEDAEAYEQLLAEVRDELRRARQEGRGDWVVHNLGETLPHPTPLTWSLIRRFMSGQGGFGQMYCRVGFEPSQRVCREGFLDLIGGRIYMDLSRAPQMFMADFPYRYDPDLLRRRPDAAQGPPTLPCGSPWRQLVVARRLKKINARLEVLAEDFDRQLEQRILPELVDYVGREKQRNLAELTVEQWRDLWQERCEQVLDRFAADCLMPGLILGMAMEDLRRFLAEHFWDHDADALVNELSAGGPADLTVQANQDLYEVAHGRRTVAWWLERYGHRGPEELDLAAPRWRQRPDELADLAGHLKNATSPLARQRARAEQVGRTIEQLARTLRAAARKRFRLCLDRVHRYMRYREDAKHYLMLGYDLLRDMALEVGRRLDIGQDVFFLDEEELCDALTAGVAPLHIIEQRRSRRMAERRLVLPDLITEKDLPHLGTVRPTGPADRLEAMVLSGGSARGPARIVLSPQEAGNLGKDYVLVCPSTDPSWTPLFIGASALVLERGGALSHGAVVAREMGIPAVVLPGATRLLEEGQTVIIDGRRGLVLRPCEQAESGPGRSDRHDCRLEPEQVPPVPGRPERRANRLRNVFLAVWAVYLVMFFAWPAVHEGSLSVLDAVLLPVVARAGRPATVAMVAGLLAVLTMVGQRCLTDHRRLRLAKKRAGRLKREARGLPADSPRRALLSRLVGQVQGRLVQAAFVPLAVLLGPMVVSFVWLAQRVDTASLNAPPGSTVIVTAVVDGDYAGPVRLSVARPLALAEQSDAEQRIFLARPYLERHLRRLRDSGSDRGAMAWDLALVVEQVRGAYLEQLEKFLAGPMPPQKLTWAVTTPPGQAGRWPMTLKADGQEPVTVDAVLGDGYPPPHRQDLTIQAGRRRKVEPRVQLWQAASDKAMIKQVQVRYRVSDRVKGDAVFWQPLRWFEVDETTGPVKALFPPWLVLYLVVYVPVMFAARWALGVP